MSNDIKSGVAGVHQVYRNRIAELETTNAALVSENARLREDAERGRYMIEHGCWHRGEEQTHLAILVPQGSDLSCYATRARAIDLVRKESANGN